MRVKTRFAPSPTGYLHVGCARTALYSWLYARHNAGKFVLRIEDTDLERSNAKATDVIIESMNWLNLDWDEGPYYQSQRLERYNEIIDTMLAVGTAYKCYCSKERLASIREKQIIKGEKPRYDGFCRNNSNNFYKNKKSYVVRFCNPLEGKVVFNDCIRGVIEFNNQELDDLIIRRTDGSPTYNFCVVIDDWDMGITHVIRGEDHINNTPRQINILKAIGATIPMYSHVSMIHGKNGKKLSKRYDAVSVMQYQKEGYLPEAMLNYLLRLGWSHGDQEFFSKKDMVDLFTLDAISKSPSIFDIKKLRWLNHYYINKLPRKYVTRQLKQYIEQQNFDTSNGPALEKILELFGKRCKTLIEIASSCQYFYKNIDTYDSEIVEKCLSPTVYFFLEIVYQRLTKIPLNEWTANNLHYVIYNTANELKISVGKVCMPIRIAITGTNQSPSLNIILELIGRNRSLDRINKALIFFSKFKKMK